MRKLWIWLSLTAVSSIIIACIMYGTYVFLYPAVFVLTFFVAFGLNLVLVWEQDLLTPGLEELPEPSSFWSRTYEVWLYHNRREDWARYACFCIGLAAILGGSLIGYLVWALLRAPPNTLNATVIGWFLGVFLLISNGVMIASSDYWSEY